MKALAIAKIFGSTDSIGMFQHCDSAKIEEMLQLQ